MVQNLEKLRLSISLQVNLYEDTRSSPVETQLFYCNSRYYNPEWGRWISPDSIEYLDPSSINGLNLYAYCENDPVNKFDPSGCLVWWVVALIVLGVVLVTAGTVVGTALYVDYNLKNGYKDDLNNYDNVASITLSNGTEVKYVINKNDNNPNKSELIIINAFSLTDAEIDEFLEFLQKENRVLNVKKIKNEIKWHQLAYMFGFKQSQTASVNVYFNSDDEGHGIFSDIMNNIYIIIRNI